MTSSIRHPFPDWINYIDVWSSLTINQAPESVGLYAWYGQLSFGPKDWEQSMWAGVDEGEKTCRSLLQRHTTRYTNPKLKIEGRGAFSTMWRGSLDDISIERLRSIIAGEAIPLGSDGQDHPDDFRRFEKFQYVLGRADLRGTLLKALKISTPFISAPIYVGVADRLRDRLKQHSSQLAKLTHLVGQNPDKKRQLLESSNSTFASRALAMGFNEDTVVVWTINLESLFYTIEREDLRAVAESAEWLLNRWHKPLLGKR